MENDTLKDLIIDATNVIEFIESAALIVLAETLSQRNKKFIIITESNNAYTAIDKMVEDFAEHVVDIEGVARTLKTYLRKPHGRPRKELERRDLYITNKKSEMSIISAENFVARKFLNEIKKYM